MSAAGKVSCDRADASFAEKSPRLAIDLPNPSIGLDLIFINPMKMATNKLHTKVAELLP